MANIFSKWFGKNKDKQTEEEFNIKEESDISKDIVQIESSKTNDEQSTKQDSTEIQNKEIQVAYDISKDLPAEVFEEQIDLSQANDEDKSEEHKQESTENSKTEIQLEKKEAYEEESQQEFIEKPQGLLSRLKEGLSKTSKNIKEKFDAVLANFRKIDEQLFEELEEVLITSDIGVQTTQDIIEDIKRKVKLKNITEPKEIKLLLKEKIKEILVDNNFELNIQSTPSVLLIVGVNGVGKTTSIGKIANRLKKEGKTVLLAAADTFRAAAIDQLEIWGKRVGVEVIKHQEGSDPGAVVYDAVQAAKARKSDVVICDTAGRLHNKKNLMDELGKVHRIVDRELPNCPKEVLLVLDATTGQNAVQQAKTFNESTKLTGIILTKLDGTAKGGIVITIKSELNIPIKFIGVGEGLNDLQKFNPESFVDALFEE